MAIFVLVHGGWHGGWCWKKIMPTLHNAGYTVYTPTLTGLGERVHLLTPEVGLYTHVQDIVALLEYEDLQQVILVGHSYSGVVITAVAEQAAARIAHLVYLDAFVPQDGQCLFDLLDAPTLAAFQELAESKGDGWRIPAPPLSRYGITHADDLAWMNPRIGDQPLKCMTDKVQLTNLAAWQLARTYIACTDEQRPALAAMAHQVRNQSGWHYREIATGHDAMVTAPQELANLFLEITIQHDRA